MRLVYDKKFKGKWLPVAVGDDVTLDGKHYLIDYIEKPHHAGSTGRVHLRDPMADGTTGYYPSVIDATWIEREDRGWVPRKDEQGNINRMYGWTVGQYVTLKRFADDEADGRVQEGTVMRIVSISPRVAMRKEWAVSNPNVYDDKPYFLNLARVGDTYPRVRVDFVMVRRTTREELTVELTKVEKAYMRGRLVI